MSNLSHGHEDNAEPSLQVVYEEPEGKSLNAQLNFIPPKERNTALPSQYVETFKATDALIEKQLQTPPCSKAIVTEMT